MEALRHYGCICNRCGEYGNDVHHKTYERTGGDELMDDLEVLCRDCHEAHHSVDKTSGRKQIRGIHKRSIFGRLSQKHKDVLLLQFPDIHNGNDLFIAINSPSENQVAEAAAKLLGCGYAFTSVPRRPKEKKYNFIKKYG